MTSLHFRTPVHILCWINECASTPLFFCMFLLSLAEEPLFGGLVVMIVDMRWRHCAVYWWWPTLGGATRQIYGPLMRLDESHGRFGLHFQLSELLSKSFILGKLPLLPGMNLQDLGNPHLEISHLLFLVGTPFQSLVVQIELVFSLDAHLGGMR